MVEQWIENPCVPGSIPGETTNCPSGQLFKKLKVLKQPKKGFLAQLVEQWIENPCVPGSIPGETT